MTKRFFAIALLLAFATLPMAGLQAQKKIDQPPVKDPKVAPTPKAGEPKKYDDVILKTAKSMPGIFLVHKVDDKIYFEIPEDGFNKLMLWQAEVAKGPAGVTYGGFSLGSRYLRFDRRGRTEVG